MTLPVKIEDFLPTGPLTLRERIDKLADTMLDVETYETMTAVQTNVSNLIHGGMFIRQVTLAAGSYIVGSEWRVPNILYVLKGKVSMANDDVTVELEAPAFIVGRPFTRRAFIIHEEAVLQTVCVTPYETLEETLDYVSTEPPTFTEYS